MGKKADLAQKAPQNPRGLKKPRGKPFPPGNSGKPKGTKNKFPTALKDKVLHAAAVLEAEGKDLAAEAMKDPRWFWETFVKPMLPKEVWMTGDPSRPLTFRVIDDSAYSKTKSDGSE